MIGYIISLSILTLAVIVLRGAFKGSVSARLTYAIWLAVVLRLCLPVSLVQVDMPYLSLDRLESYFAQEIVLENGAEESPESLPQENVTVQRP